MILVLKNLEKTVILPDGTKQDRFSTILDQIGANGDPEIPAMSRVIQPQRFRRVRQSIGDGGRVSIQAVG